jgi:Na+-translocating ferredoxin:NAD+ oxidoreductase RnfG subunit
LLTAFSIKENQDYPGYLQKKIDRILHKTFKNEIITSRQKELAKLNSEDAIFYILNDKNDTLGLYIIQLNTGCKLGGCMDLVTYDPNETYETFYCMTIYNKIGEIIQVSVLEYDGNYGYEITANSWLKQFKFKRGERYKLGENIDGISGATISANSMVNLMNDQQNIIDSLINSSEANVPH